MRNQNKTPASAIAAIAAVLALPTTPALAQDAATAPADVPIVTVPPMTTTAPVAPVTTPSPTIVLPDTSVSSTTTTAPSNTTAPSATTTPKASTATTTAQRTSQPATTRAEVAPASVKAAPVKAVAAPLSAPTPAEPLAVDDTPVAPVAVAPVMAEEPSTQAAPTPEQTSDVTGLLALLLIGLVGLAVAGFALLAFRRRPKKTYRAEPVIEQPVVDRRPIMPAAVATETVVPATIAASPIVPAYRDEPVDTGLANQGAAVALPRELPESFEERDALLKRMVEAQPDRANPFTSYKARVHRARLILQSLGRKFERAQPWIDLSQYSRNWPALAQRPAYQAA